MSSAAVHPVPRQTFAAGANWPLIAAFAVIAIPTAISLSQQTWTQESGAHGPIVLATGGWLLLRQAPELRRSAQPGRLAWTYALLGAGLVAYVLGSIFDFVTIQALGVYVAGLAMLHATLGPKLILKNWFPLFYLAFAIPPPTFLMDALTAPLKSFVSMAATDTLAALGFPIARDGVIIFIAQYELLVEDACSGMNSLIGLTAISLFYIYLARGSSLLYSLILTAFVIPIAIAANLVRIMVLVLLTYYFGDQVAQGFAHTMAGVFLFITALLLIIVLDRGLGFLASQRKRAR